VVCSVGLFVLIFFFFFFTLCLFCIFDNFLRLIILFSRNGFPGLCILYSFLILYSVCRCLVSQRSKLFLCKAGVLILSV
jgi:hypothetical protein